MFVGGRGGVVLLLLIDLSVHCLFVCLCLFVSVCVCVSHIGCVRICMCVCLSLSTNIDCMCDIISGSVIVMI